MLNTLANVNSRPHHASIRYYDANKWQHGFLPRDGRNITKENAIKALGDGLNFDSDLASIMWEQAIIVNPEPNATFFTLDQLNVHNLLEHDASLSRSDAFFGNNHVFNQTIFDTSRKWWPDSIITAKQLAHSKIYRQIESRSSNPKYTFTPSTEEFSLGEVAAPIIAFGDMTSGTVRRDMVEFFFRKLLNRTGDVGILAYSTAENERLPTCLGWTKKASPVTLWNILDTTAMVRNATNLLTGTENANTAPRKSRDLHTGFSF